MPTPAGNIRPWNLTSLLRNDHHIPGYDYGRQEYQNCRIAATIAETSFDTCYRVRFKRGEKKLSSRMTRKIGVKKKMAMVNEMGDSGLASWLPQVRSDRRDLLRDPEGLGRPKGVTKFGSASTTAHVLPRRSSGLCFSEKLKLNNITGRAV